jgi:dihydroneopterin aldolase
MDKILIRGLSLRCRVGVPDEERARSQRLVADADLLLDLRPAAATDDFNRTVDYNQACQVLAEVASQGPYRLLETVAERMAAALLGLGPARVRLLLKKPAALASWKADYAAVEIVRDGPS